MTDSPDFPRSADDDVDPAALAAVQRALGELDFLRPPDSDDPAVPRHSADSDDSAVEPMPDWAWARITSALIAEGAATASSGHGRGPSRATRWAGGLVAASVAVVAVGVGVTAFRGTAGTGGVVVAGDAAPMSAASTATAGAAEAVGAAPKDLTAERQLSFAGMVPPALRLIGSDTPYTADHLREQVSTVLADNGMPPSATAVQQAMSQPPSPTAMVDVPANGFTQSAASLRDCVTKLTAQAQSTALLVDRSTFEGSEAGVVVAPEDADSPAPAAPDELEVMVVDRDCNLILKVWLTLDR